MMEQWKALTARFDALSMRERAMLALAVLFVVGMPGYTFLLEPQKVKAATQAKRVDKLTSELAQLETQIMVTQAQVRDPDAANRAALPELKKQLATLDEKLRRFETSLVPPNKMPVILQSLLSKNGSLELLAMRTMPPTNLIERAAGDKSEPNIYKHGVEIRIAGRYGDLLAYLTEMERMSQRILWNRIALSVDQYPRNVVTLTVYTLSLDKQWLVV